ncbi:hypothetical protein JCM10213_006008 [Rhodosporidiobolus nylandii]
MTSFRDRIMYGHLVSLRNEALTVGCVGSLSLLRRTLNKRHWQNKMWPLYGPTLGGGIHGGWKMLLISWLVAVCCASPSSSLSTPRRWLSRHIAPSPRIQNVLLIPLLLFFVLQHPVILLFFAHRFFRAIRNWHHSRENRILLSELVDAASESITGVVRRAGLAQRLEERHNALLLIRNDRLSNLPFDSSSPFGQQYQQVTKAAALAFLPFTRLPDLILIRFHEYLASANQLTTLAGAVPVARTPLLEAIQPRILRHPVPIKPPSRRARVAMALQLFLPTWELLDAYLHLLQDFVTLTLTTFAALFLSSSPQDPVDFRRILDRFFGFTFTILSADPSATISIQPVLDSLAFQTFALLHYAWVHAVSAVSPPHESRLHFNFFIIEVELAARQDEAQKAQQDLMEAVFEAVLRWKEVKIERERAATKAQRQMKHKVE